MSFDLHGAWEGVIGHLAPLYAGNTQLAQEGYLTVVRKRLMTGQTGQQYSGHNGVVKNVPTPYILCSKYTVNWSYASVYAILLILTDL